MLLSFQFSENNYYVTLQVAMDVGDKIDFSYLTRVNWIQYVATLNLSCFFPILNTCLLYLKEGERDMLFFKFVLIRSFIKSFSM